MAVTSPEDVRDARGDDAGRSLPATPHPDSPYGARPERSVGGSAARIALIYLIVALAWVIFSDRIVGAVVASHSLLTRVQTFKGSAFVSGSALLIYLLLRRELRNREQARSELRGAETKYRTLVEQIPCIVYIAAFGPTGEWLYVSPRVREVLGDTPKEWMAQLDPLATRLHPEDRDRVLTEEARCQEEGTPFRCEYRVRTRDGEVVWIRDEAVPMPSTPELWQGVMLDITEQKRAEEVLRSTIATLRENDEERRELLSRLVEAREEEHRRIAAEVHDGPVQKMVAVGLRLEMLRRGRSDPGDLDTLDELARVVDGSTRELRHLLFELVPPTLEASGLADALRELLHEVIEEGDLRVHLEDRLATEPGEPARTGCFRITQEALRNVQKHAAAGSVEVVLQSSESGVRVRVRDNGRGFEPNGSVPAGHFGLVVMRERAESAGGWLKIDSAPGEGTAVEFWLPESDVRSA